MLLPAFLLCTETTGYATCPLLDNPERNVEIIEASGAKSTDFLAPENVCDLSAKCVGTSERWAQSADRIWKLLHGCADYIYIFCVLRFFSVTRIYLCSCCMKSTKYLSRSSAV